MIYTKKALVEILEQYEDEDILVGVLWSKFDVEYELSEVASQSDFEGIDQTKLEAFSAEGFWNSYFETMEKAYDSDIAWQSGELYSAIVERLKGEN